MWKLSTTIISISTAWGNRPQHGEGAFSMFMIKDGWPKISNAIAEELPQFA